MTAVYTIRINMVKVDGRSTAGKFEAWRRAYLRDRETDKARAVDVSMARPATAGRARVKEVRV